MAKSLVRRAILISAPATGTVDELPGPPIDMAGSREWLTSPSGGRWFNLEIEELEDPDEETVREAIRRADDADYAFVLFSGHGATLDGQQVGFVDGGQVTIDELIPGVPKCTLVMDACRDLVQVPLVRPAIPLLEDRVVRRNPDRDFRGVFDRFVTNAAEGVVVLQSCSKAQRAGDTPDGGIFCHSLLATAEDFARKGAIRPQGIRPKWLSVEAAFDRAQQATTAKNRRQRPELEFTGEEIPRFPFGV